MRSTLQCLFLLHISISAVSFDFLVPISSAANRVGKAEAAVVEGAEKTGTAVADGAEKIGNAVVDVSEKKAGRVAEDAALQKAGRCEQLLGDRHEIEQMMSPLIARGFQESEEDPSADASACRKVVGDTALALMHRHWHDVVGLSDHIATGILDRCCNLPLMQSLKTLEATRKSDDKGYQEHMRETLRESVFTDVLIEDLLESHCGGSHVLPAQIFAESPIVAMAQRDSLSLATFLVTMTLAILLRPYISAAALMCPCL